MKISIGTTEVEIADWKELPVHHGGAEKILVITFESKAPLAAGTAFVREGRGYQVISVDGTHHSASEA